MFRINFHKVVVRHFHIADIFEKNLFPMLIKFNERFGFARCFYEIERRIYFN